jgi:DNA-binding transcriptional LysR family regulator
MKALEQIDLNMLLLLDWLLKEQSVTRAAERMGVTQSAASRSLQKLRQTFGDELLVRSGRATSLSRLAQEIQPGLASAIMKLREVARTEDSFDPGNATQNFTIASNDYLAAIGAEAWQNAVAPHATKLKSNWRPLESEVVSMLASAQVDIVLAPYAAQPNMPKSATLQDMVVKPLVADRFVLFAAADHALIRSKTISLSDFAKARHVLVSPQGAGRGIVDQILDKQDMKREIAHRSWSFGLAAELALMTDSIAVLPERLAKRYPSARSRELPFEIGPLQSFIAWHSSRTSDQAHRWVRDRFIDHFDIR